MNGKLKKPRLVLTIIFFHGFSDKTIISLIDGFEDVQIATGVPSDDQSSFFVGVGGVVGGVVGAVVDINNFKTTNTVPGSFKLTNLRIKISVKNITTFLFLNREKIFT